MSQDCQREGCRFPWPILRSHRPWLLPWSAIQRKSCVSSFLKVRGGKVTRQRHPTLPVGWRIHYVWKHIVPCPLQHVVVASEASLVSGSPHWPVSFMTSIKWIPEGSFFSVCLGPCENQDVQWRSHWELQPWMEIWAPFSNQLGNLHFRPSNHATIEAKDAVGAEEALSESTPGWLCIVQMGTTVSASPRPWTHRTLAKPLLICPASREMAKLFLGSLHMSVYEMIGKHS